MITNSVQKKFSLIAIMGERIDQKQRSRLAPENRLALQGNGRDEEDAGGFHFLIFGNEREGVCDGCHKSGVEKSKTGARRLGCHENGKGEERQGIAQAHGSLRLSIPV